MTGMTALLQVAALTVIGLLGLNLRNDGTRRIASATPIVGPDRPMLRAAGTAEYGLGLLLGAFALYLLITTFFVH